MEVLHAIVHLLVLPFVLIVRMGVACRLGRGLLLFLVPGLLTLEATASQDRELQLSWSSRRRQLLMYLLPTIFLAASFTIPVVYEIDTEKITLCNHTLEIAIPSKMRLNPYYSTLLTRVVKNPHDIISRFI